MSTAHPKPEKRKNAKERAKEKYAKDDTKDGTTPDMTAKAKSKVATKAKKGKAKQGGRKPPEFEYPSNRIAPIGTRLRKAAATEDGGEGVFAGIPGRENPRHSWT